MDRRPGVRGRSGSLALVRVLVTASMAGTSPRGHDLGRQGALPGDPDQLAAAVADREVLLVGGLQGADDVGHLVAAARRRPAPADDHPLAHVPGADADDVAVAHPTTVEPSDRPVAPPEPPPCPPTSARRARPAGAPGASTGSGWGCAWSRRPGSAAWPCSASRPTPAAWRWSG